MFTSRPQRKTFVKKRHTGRNVSIVAVLVVAAVIGIALSGALSPPATYFLVVHVYDSRYQPYVHSVLDINETMLIANVTVTVAGTNQPTRFTPTGIIGYEQVPAGTYQISLSGNASITSSFSYTVGENCADRTSDGQCHALVPATITHSQ